MDRLLNLTFAAAVALICALTASDVVRHLVAPLPSAAPLPRAPRPAATPPAPPLQVERLARLTGLPLPEPTELAVVEPAFDPSAEPVATSLRLKLLGTLIASPAEWSMASIEEVDARNTSSLMVGDLVLGAQLLEIERERVVLLNNGVREYLAMTRTPLPAKPPPAQARAQVAARPPGRRSNEPELGAGIKATSEHSYEIPRTEVDRALGNLGQLATKARIVPAFKDGKSVGFKLFGIRPGSLYTKIGIQNGDVIRRINGYDLNAPEKALEVYMKLKEAGRIDLELERKGSVVRKTYNIR